MPDTGLRDAIGESFDAGDTAEATAPETTTPPEKTPETTTPTDTAETPATEPEWKIDSAEFDQQHPELAPYRKQLQADYTRRQQESAEKLRMIDGLDEGSVQWMRQVRQLAQTNPDLAAQLLEQERLKLMPQQQQPDPLQDTQWLSDGERLLAQQVQQLQQTVRQQEIAYQRAAVEAETAQLERTIGKTLTPAERDELYTFAASKRLNLEDSWKLKDYDRAVMNGRAAVQKAGMGPAPGGVASREGPAAAAQPKTAREAIEMAFDEAERRAA